MSKGMELLAPAGGMAELIAAVQSGADAVYLGADMFSARAGAGNFDRVQLKSAVEYAHFYGVKVHCAINTLIKEKELESAVATAIMAAECGVDALIIQDIGLAKHLGKVLPEIELHASTQMTVTSLEGVKYLEEQGFSRVVLARELDMAEIEKIVKGAKAEIEVFVHGAICMSYSGQCLMSSILGGRSGNRGRCAQPCRLCYDLLENGKVIDSAYILSPKDMALIDHLNSLKRTGVASLKIEGRLKSAEYVSAVTSIYRKYIDSGDRISREDMTELKNAFSRSGFTDGYFTGQLGENMMSHKNPANNSGSTFTKEATDRANGKVVRHIPITVYATLNEGEAFCVTAYDNDGNCITATGTEVAQKALKTPLTSERVCEQLGKLGGTGFVAESIHADVADGITVPIKEINQVRRDMCEMLWKARVGENAAAVCDVPVLFKKNKETVTPCLTASVRTLEQGRAVIMTGGVKRIYASPDVAEKLAKESNGCEVITRLSDIVMEEDIPTNTAMVSSAGAMYKYGEKAQYGDFRMNVFNSLTAEVLSELKCVTLSPELNLREIADVVKHTENVETELIGYGRIPLMIMKNCPVKAMGKCQSNKDVYSLRDRKNMEFPIICQKGCRAMLLNSKPIYTADIIEEIIRTNVNAIRLDFTVESPQECKDIVNKYIRALAGDIIAPMEENTFTRGHLRRGVI